MDMVVLFWIIAIGGAIVVGFLAMLAGHAIFFGNDPYKDDLAPPKGPYKRSKYAEPSEFMKTWNEYRRKTYGKVD